MRTVLSTRFPEWLEVVRLDSSDWRISDSRIAEGTVGRLLGYIDKIPRDRYELLWTGEPFRWAYMESFATATGAFAEGARFSGPTTVERDRDAAPPQAASLRRIRRRAAISEQPGQHVA